MKYNFSREEIDKHLEAARANRKIEYLLLECNSMDEAVKIERGLLDAGFTWASGEKESIYVETLLKHPRLIGISLGAGLSRTIEGIVHSQRPLSTLSCRNEVILVTPRELRAQRINNFI